MSARYTVRLDTSPGRHGVSARLQSKGWVMIGRIQRGAQFGALMQTPDGRYVLVNGDHVSELNQSQVACALKRAQARPSGPAQHHARPADEARSPPAGTPKVIIKRKRVIVQAHDASNVAPPAQ